MKAEEAKKIADQALQNLTDALKNGKSERITQYLAMLAKFHRYSFGNVLLILSQMPAARETEAEAVAFVVCQAIGLETGSAASDYIQLYDGKT